MNRPKQLVLTCLAAALLVLSACDRPGERRRGAASPGTWQQMHRQMATAYDSMRTWYDRHVSQMPTDLQEMYQQMDTMHGQWNQMQEGMMGSGGMMGGSMHGGMMSMHRMQEWDQQMMAMHQAMAQMHREAGEEEVARWHEKMMRSYGQMMEQVPDTVVRQAPPPPEDSFSGRALYARHCASCHGGNGEGVARAFPPLAQSEWVTGNKQRLIRILLHGMQGGIEVRGQSYNGMMPAFGARLSNEEMAAVLSYVRTSWNNNASRISEKEVEAVRRQYREQRTPWSASELK